MPSFSIGHFHLQLRFFVLLKWSSFIKCNIYSSFFAVFFFIVSRFFLSVFHENEKSHLKYSMVFGAAVGVVMTGMLLDNHFGLVKILCLL